MQEPAQTAEKVARTTTIDRSLQTRTGHETQEGIVTKTTQHGPLDTSAIIGNDQPTTLVELAEELNITEAELPETAVRKLRERRRLDRHNETRGILKDLGAEFLPKDRRVLTPRIIMSGSALRDQIARLVPDEDASFPEGVTVDVRRAAAEEAIVEMARYVDMQPIVSPVPRDEQRAWRAQMEAQYPDFIHVYKHNSLSGNKIGVVTAALGTLARVIGNEQLATLLQAQAPKDYKGDLREWADVIQFFTDGPKGEYAWMTKPLEEKLPIIGEINDVVIGVLNMLSAGMQGKQSVMRMT